MGRGVKILQISALEKEALKDAYKKTKDKRYACRCRIILLKSDPEGYSNVEVARILDITKASVGNWLNRYRKEGLDGLSSRPIPGRPNILNFHQDGPTIKEQVRLNRQRLGVAHDIIQEKVGKQFSQPTLHRFLKSLTAATSVSVSDREKNPTQNSMKSLKNSFV